LAKEEPEKLAESLRTCTVARWGEGEGHDRSNRIVTTFCSLHRERLVMVPDVITYSNFSGVLKYETDTNLKLF